MTALLVDGDSAVAGAIDCDALPAGVPHAHPARELARSDVESIDARM